MFLEHLADAEQFLVRAGQNFLKVGNGIRCADAGHHVFALGVHHELAPENVFAGGGVAGEGDAGAGVVAGVAEHHRLHVDRRAPLDRDVVLAAVNDGAVVHPRTKHSADRAAKLVPWIIRERLAGTFLHEFLELGDEHLQILGGKIGVIGVSVAEEFLLHLLDEDLERLLVLGRQFLHTHDDVAVHLDKAPVAVPGEAGVAAGLGQGLDRLLVQAKVKNCVHHTRHRLARAGANGEQERVLFVAELLAELPLHPGDPILHLLLQHFGVRLFVVVVVGADLGGDGASRRHRETDACHLGEVRALAAEERLHLAVAIGFFAEVIDVFRSFFCCHKLCSDWGCRV